MKLIIGLGNPGNEYELTRHNIGFMIVDKYVGSTSNFKEKFNALYTKCNIDGQDVIFIKPTTFMNLSGKSVVQFMNFFKIALEDILVIQDDLDMNVGTFKLKKNSSDGGHNGIKSITSLIGSKNYARLKVGILNEYKFNTNDFVLKKFTSEDLEQIFKNDYNKVIKMFILNGYDNTINRYKGEK